MYNLTLIEALKYIKDSNFKIRNRSQKDDEFIVYKNEILVNEKNTVLDFYYLNTYFPDNWRVLS